VIRTQICLSERQHRALRLAAKREGISMPELRRRMVDRRLLGRIRAADHSKDAVMSFIGLGASGQADVSVRHDEALDEAFRDDAVR
jgi:hypothetical protein